MRTRLLPALLLLVLIAGVASSAAADGGALDVVAAVGLPVPVTPEPEPVELQLTGQGDVLVVSHARVGGDVGGTVADPATGEVLARFGPGLLDLLDADAVLDDGDLVQLAGWGRTRGDERWFYAVWTVDAGTGELLEHSRVDAVPEGLPETRAAFADDGTLYLLVERPDDGVDLLAVDPDTGAATATTRVDPGVPDLHGVEPWLLAISPDGRTVTVAIGGSSSGDSADGSVLARFDSSLRPLGASVALGSATELVVADALSVTDDGTVWIGVRRYGAGSGATLLELAPGAAAPRALAGYRDAVADLVADGDDLWVLGPDLHLFRVDPRDGSVEATTALCADEYDNDSGGVLVGPDGTVYVTGVCGPGEDDALWVLARSRWSRGGSGG